MAEIKSSVELYDGFTGVLNNIMNAINLTVSSFEEFQRMSGNEINTAALEGAREAANQATIAMNALNEAAENAANMGGGPGFQPPTPEPVEIPVTWKMDDMPVFDTSGVERFQQEIEDAQGKLSMLGAVQEHINQTAAAAHIFPPQALTDLNTMQTRIQGIQNRINQIASNPINIGSKAANTELERLRRQLSQAVNAQQALNSAVDNMDVEAANDAYLRLSNTVSDTERYIRDNVDEQGRLNSNIEDGNSIAENLANTVKTAVKGAIEDGAAAAARMGDTIQKAIGAIAGIATIKKAYDFVGNVTSAFNTQLNAEVQLARVLGNTLESDVGGAFDAIKAKASQIQSAGIYGDEAMLAGAAELSTYMSDTEAIMSMMDTLSNYAMGMSGGGELDSTAMTDYATNIGKIMAGSYDAMTKKGFEFTDAQKAVIKGTATQAQLVEAVGEDYASMSDDMQKATVINDIIAESWDGLYESMSNTPEGQIIQFKNTLGDLKEQIGGGLYPAVLDFVGVFQENFPQIEEFAGGLVTIFSTIIEGAGEVINSVMQFGDGITDALGGISPIVAGIQIAIGLVVNALQWLMQTAVTVAQTIVDNWSWIGPILMGVATIFLLYQAYTLLAAGAQAVLNAIQAASPIFWIVAGVIALIAGITAVVRALDVFGSKSHSVFGTLTGCINVAIQFFVNLGLTVADIALGIWNAIGACCDNIGIAFHNVITSVKGWFYGLLSTAMNVVAGICEALNKLPFVEFDYSGIVAKADEYAAKSAEAYGAKKDYVSVAEAFDKGYKTFDTFKDGWAQDAFDAGANWGDGVTDSVTDFLEGLTDGITDAAKNPINPDDYTNVYDGGGGIGDNVNKIANNTGKMADKIDISEEELKYLRDIAEQETINRFTTAEINLDFSGMQNTIGNDMDLDGVIDTMIDGVNEAVEIATKGVHT